MEWSIWGWLLRKSSEFSIPPRPSKLNVQVYHIPRFYILKSYLIVRNRPRIFLGKWNINSFIFKSQWTNYFRPKQSNGLSLAFSYCLCDFYDYLKETQTEVFLPPKPGMVLTKIDTRQTRTSTEPYSFIAIQ